MLEAGLAVQAEDDSFYGFALARRISDMRGGLMVAHGTLYKALGRLTSAGLLEASWEDPEIAETQARPRRRLYRVTGEGEAALAAEVEQGLIENDSRARRTSPGAATA